MSPEVAFKNWKRHPAKVRKWASPCAFVLTYFDFVARCHYHSRNRSAPRRSGIPKRESGLWPEKVSTDASAANRGRRRRVVYIWTSAARDYQIQGKETARK